MDRCRALRKAALAEMAAVEKRHGTTHPFFWSAFVFLGDPGGNRP
jgi:CHAT domain-containing protein